MYLKLTQHCKLTIVQLKNVFWGSCKLFFIPATSFYNPTNSNIRVPISSHSWQHGLIFVFLIIVILINVRQKFIVFLICISLIIGDVEYFFMYLLAFVYLLWRYIYSSSLTIEKNKLHFFLHSCTSCSYILNINSLPYVWFANIFSVYMHVVFLLCFIVPLICRNVLVWCTLTCLFLLLLSVLLVS